jgi:DNA invertase Pin-like site-specific DNA recombinase
LQLHILGAMAVFERARIAERVRAGFDRGRGQGTKLGRPQREAPESVRAPVRGLSVREAAKRLGVSTATAHRWLSKASHKAKRGVHAGAPRYIYHLFLTCPQALNRGRA